MISCALVGHDADDTLPARRRVEPAATLSPGTRVRDYVVREQIAEGGFGTVYRVEHVILGRLAALKVLHSELVSSNEAVARFEREARAVNVIRHPNVVDIYDFGRLPDGRPYFLMEHLAGTDLSNYLSSVGALSLDETLAILAPLCDALATAHAKGIVHRDVKPSNLFLCDAADRRRIVLLDFGIAKLVAPGNEGLTTSRHRIGTPSYMAPEQLAGVEVDARADVYSVGVLAYQLLTGALPFGEGSAAVLLNTHQHASRPRVSQRVAVPAGIDEAIVTAMAFRREDRFATISELASALERAAADSRAKARSPERGQRARAIAIFVDVQIDPDVLAEADDALLADLDAALVAASDVRTTHDLAVAAETGTSVLLVSVLPDEPARATELQRAILEVGRRLHERLSTRSGRDPRVHVNVTLHLDQVVLANGRVRGGELTQLSRWVPQAALSCVVATPEALDGITAGTPCAGNDRLRQF